MRLFLLFSFLLLISLATFGCKDYSTGLQQSSSRADETSAIATLRTLAQAQTTYSISNAGHFATFEQLVEGGFLDSRFHHPNPTLHGYIFTLEVLPASNETPGSYTCNADPVPTSPPGVRHFYIDSNSQDIRINASLPATIKDKILRP
ncbi:MAG: hypothetical protein M3447_11585 [Acidobacteriota bacterium]|nr:hypothetical protein [Acidobacteriota bacterium]